MLKNMKPISALVLTGNVRENWQTFSDEFLRFIDESRCQSEKIKKTLLLTAVGKDALDACERDLNQLNENATLEMVMHVFEAYCKSYRNNELYQIFTLYTRTQGINESINEYYSAVSELAKSCGFGQSDKDIIRNAIIVGMKDSKIREKLFIEGITELDDIIRYIKSNEMLSVAEISIENMNDGNIDEFSSNVDLGNLGNVNTRGIGEDLSESSSKNEDNSMQINCNKLLFNPFLHQQREIGQNIASGSLSQETEVSSSFEAPNYHLHRKKLKTLHQENKIRKSHSDKNDVVLRKEKVFKGYRNTNLLEKKGESKFKQSRKENEWKCKKEEQFESPYKKLPIQSSKPKIYVCDYNECSYTTKLNSNYYRHKRTHLPPIYSCKCGYNSNRSDNFKNHSARCCRG